jgi:hypothetical protein
MTAQPIHDLPPRVLGPGDPSYDRWWSEVQHFKGIRQQLWDQPDLRMKYVALYRHEVVDQDVDQFVLGKRMALRYPGEVFLVVQVALEDRRIELPSPEMRH